jgi:hypothetical protein
MTEIYVYCPICNEEDGKETRCEKIKIVLGTALYKLSCGHIIGSDGLIVKPDQEWQFRDI